MSFSGLFIARPIATTLLSIGLLIAGLIAYFALPVAPLPSVDIPTIVVFANRPGAEPETMATSISAPLERRLGEIAGVTELTSTSGSGTATIIVQFDINRNLDSAAHDVQAAINAATADLPSDLPTRPYFRKFNPAQAPVMTIALTSDSRSLGQIYDAADTVLGQRLSQVPGVSQVTVNGAEKPAVRVQLDPAALAAAHLSSQQVYTAIRSANVNGAIGGFEGPDRSESIAINGQIGAAADYRGLVLKNNGGAVTRLSDVANVVDALANARLAASFGDKPAILLNITKLADANIIKTVDAIRAVLPQLATYIPPDIKITILTEGTATIRASVHDISITLLITVALVLLVVMVFMRRTVPIIAAAVTVPLSIAGTLVAMWACGFALDNFSLLAITISVGFVVDDAIVMIENIVRHIERGEQPMAAAIRGSRQIGFTVLSISISLVAVFIPLLFLGGILGRLLHEFATTLTLAIGVSALVSLTLTPMICGRFLAAAQKSTGNSLFARADRATERALDRLLAAYATSLDWALRWRRLMLLVTIATVGLTVWLYTVVPKGFLPTEDTGLIQGSTIASPDVSFQAMKMRQQAVLDVLLQDPAVATLGSTIGGTGGFNPQMNRGSVTLGLKPLAERGISSEAVIARLRPKLAHIGGVQTQLYSAQDLRGGGRGGASSQFVLIDQDLTELRLWAQRLEDKLRTVPQVSDVVSDQDRAGPQVSLTIDRLAATRLGVSVAAIDGVLSNAFSQRQVSVIYTQRNQYWVVLETDPLFQTDPSYLDRLYVPGNLGAQVPLRAVVRIGHDTAPLAVRHQGQFPAATLSYNVPAGTAESVALTAIQQAVQDIRMPATVRTDFAGNARFLADSLNSLPLLLVAALLTIYIVLGVLYESLAQPLTILSTIPSAGLGALLALLVTGTDLSIIAIIAVLLLMGIVKKNAIMLVDFALEQERHHGLSPEAAIRAACLERFRPIIMTTLAALFGAIPLAVASGVGAEFRQPLGIAICGGLIVSQMLTLYTTPVVYLALQRRQARPVARPVQQRLAAAE